MVRTEGIPLALDLNSIGFADSEADEGREGRPSFGGPTCPRFIGTAVQPK
jgi:hypothetical protein